MFREAKAQRKVPLNERDMRHTWLTWQTTGKDTQGNRSHILCSWSVDHWSCHPIAKLPRCKTNPITDIYVSAVLACRPTSAEPMPIRFRRVALRMVDTTLERLTVSPAMMTFRATLQETMWSCVLSWLSGALHAVSG